MTNQASSSEFELLVRKNYGFLEADFGCELQKTGNWSFQAENNFIRFTLFTEHEMLVVELQPIKNGARPFLQKNTFPTAVDVIVLIRKFHPDVQYKISWRNEKTMIMDIPLELEKRANILKNHLENFLTGSFSEWPYLEGYH